MRGVMRIKHDDWMIVFFCFFTVAPNALVKKKKKTYSILLLVRKMLTTFTNKMFLQVKRVIGVGATGNIPCIVLQAAFFEGKSYTSAAVNSVKLEERTQESPTYTKQRSIRKVWTTY